MACIIDPRFKESKFLGPEKYIQVKRAFTGLVCKEKALWEEKQGSASSQISEVNELVTKMDVLSWPSLWALIKLMTKLLTSKVIQKIQIQC